MTVSVHFPPYTGLLFGPVTIYDAVGTIVEVLTVPEFRARYARKLCPHKRRDCGCRDLRGPSPRRPAFHTCPTCGRTMGWAGVCMVCRGVTMRGAQAFKAKRGRGAVA